MIIDYQMFILSVLFTICAIIGIVVLILFMIIQIWSYTLQYAVVTLAILCISIVVYGNFVE